MYQVIKKTEIGFTENLSYNSTATAVNAENTPACTQNNAQSVSLTRRCIIYDLRSQTNEQRIAIQILEHDQTYDFLCQDQDKEIQDFMWAIKKSNTEFYRCVRLNSLNDFIKNGDDSVFQSKLKATDETITYGAYILIDTDLNVFAKGTILMENPETKADIDRTHSELSEMIQCKYNHAKGRTYTRDIDPRIIRENFNPKFTDNDVFTESKIQDFADSTARVKERAKQKQAEQMPFRPALNTVAPQSAIKQIEADFLNTLNKRPHTPNPLMQHETPAESDQEESGMILLGGGMNDDFALLTRMTRELKSCPGR